MKPELLVIADTRDSFAAAFRDSASKMGRQVLLIDFFSAAHLFTIVSGSEEGSCVEPDLPMLVRYPVSILDSDPDHLFHQAESLATVWAAAALCKSPVVGRPGPTGFGGLCSASAVITEIRGGCHVGRIEVFSSSLPSPAQLQDEWWTQSLDTLKTAQWPKRDHGGAPYRARKACASYGYEIVSVVVPDAWRSTTVPLSHLDLESKSVSLVRTLDLTFAVVTWGVSPDYTIAEVASVNPWPYIWQVKYTWAQIMPAMLRILAQ